MQTTYSIAIDGPAGAGKSTIAKALAQSLGIMYLDTGAMYRAFGLYALREGIDMDDASAVAAGIDGADIEVRFEDGAQRLYLNGEDVTRAIREPEVSLAASRVSAVPEVRVKLVALQRRIAEGHSVIMDGRDIGTKVLPNATLKIFLTASPEVRAKRRCLELAQKGMAEPYEKVLAEMIERDYNDTHRAASPLRAADDARRVDTSELNLEESVALMKRMVLETIGDKA